MTAMVIHQVMIKTSKSDKVDVEFTNEKTGMVVFKADMGRRHNVILFGSYLCLIKKLPQEVERTRGSTSPSFSV